MVLEFLTNIFLFRGSFAKIRKGRMPDIIVSLKTRLNIHFHKFYNNASPYYGKIKMTHLKIKKHFFFSFY